MTSYVMEAVENYQTAIAALVDADTNLALCFTDQLYCGMSYDHVRRKILYTFLNCANGPTTNTTGFTLWNGDNALAPGDAYNAQETLNLWVSEIDIDTRAVVIYNTYDPAQLVPAGIGGGDGTWRRNTDTDALFHGEGPKVIDPRTGNMWMHSFGAATACQVYLFELADDFAMAISPLAPILPSDHMTILGIVVDWVYVASADAVGTLVLTPRVVTAAEVTADNLLPYATYAVPQDLVDGVTRTTVGADGSLYFFVGAFSGVRDYKLFKFEQPSAFVYPTPPVDGGFTDITPWTGADGPNTDISDYTRNANEGDPNIVLGLPATDELVCINKLFAKDTGVGITDPLLFSISATYVDLIGATFDYQPGFITGYMTAGWEPTAIAADAAWSVQNFRETNIYWEFHDYDFGVDRRDHWFFVTVQPVVAGVWTPNDANNHILLVQYRFISGAPPVVLQVIDEDGWDAAYAAYAAAIGNDNVVAQSMTDSFYEIWQDNGLYDPTTNAFWWSAYQQSNMWQLNPAFAGRASNSGFVLEPFLRMSFEETPGGRRRVIVDMQALNAG